MTLAVSADPAPAGCVPATTALYFGPPGRSLFGIFRRHEPGRAARGGVLLAPPFGHEAIRTHRLYRVLADRLARIGFDSLRFDYHGSGDSSGDDAATRIAGWADDVGTADRELARLAGVPVAWWLGARLGATALLQAAAPGRAVALLLCDPILDGPRYLAELRERHVEALEASYSVADPRWRRDLAAGEAIVEEAVGFAVPPALRAELAALRPTALRPGPGACVVVRSPGDAAAVGWAAALDPAPRVVTLERDVEWNSDDSLQTALVPGDVLAALSRTVDGRGLA